MQTAQLILSIIENSKIPRRSIRNLEITSITMSLIERGYLSFNHPVSWLHLCWSGHIFLIFDSKFMQFLIEKIFSWNLRISSPTTFLIANIENNLHLNVIFLRASKKFLHFYDRKHDFDDFFKHRITEWRLCVYKRF